MKPHLSVGAVPFVDRGFAKARLPPSGEKARLRTAPRIDSRRSGSLQSPVGFARVALQMLLPSSETQAERLPSGDSIDPTGRDEEAARNAALLCPQALAGPSRRHITASPVFREELFILLTKT